MSKSTRPTVYTVSRIDNRNEAWRMSRPNLPRDAKVDIHELSKSDFGINDSRRDTLQITSSVLFRELITTVRGLDIWAQTSRVKPIRDTTLSSEYAPYDNDELFYSIVNKAADAVDSGASQDVERLDVPVTASTTYHVNANFRTWVSFLKCLRELSPNLYEVYGNLIQEKLAIDDLDYYLYDMKGGMAKTVAISPEDMELENGSVSYLGTTITKFETTLGHASHFVRHQKNMYRSNIWDIAATPMSDHLSVNSKTPLTVITTMPESSYKTILSHRADWLADWNLWSSFVEAGTSHMSTKEFWELLDPVENFAADNMERINLTDPGLPDPRLIKDPSMITQRIAKEGRNYISDRWSELMDTHLDTDESNELRIQYQNNLAKSE